MITASGTDVLIILFPKTSRVAAQGGLLFALFESVEGYIIPASGNEQPDNNLLKHLRRPPEVFLFLVRAWLPGAFCAARPTASRPASRPSTALPSTTRVCTRLRNPPTSSRRSSFRQSPAYPISGGGIAISRERVSPSMALSTTIRILS